MESARNSKGRSQFDPFLSLIRQENTTTIKFYHLFLSRTRSVTSWILIIFFFKVIFVVSCWLSLLIPKSEKWQITESREPTQSIDFSFYTIFVLSCDFYTPRTTDSTAPPNYILLFGSTLSLLLSPFNILFTLYLDLSYMFCIVKGEGVLFMLVSIYYQRFD